MTYYTPLLQFFHNLKNLLELYYLLYNMNYKTIFNLTFFENVIEYKFTNFVTL